MKITPSVAELQRENIVLELEYIDRMHLNAYVPKLTSEQGMAGYFRGFLGHRFASTKSAAGRSAALCARSVCADPLTHIPIALRLVCHMKTTVEISTPLLRRAKKMAAREGITLRTLIEEGLAKSLEARAAARPFYEPLIFTKGTGMNPEFATGGWEKIRDALYEGRGA